MWREELIISGAHRMHGSLSISQHNLEMFEEKSELRLSMSFIIKHALKRKEGVCFPDRN